MLNDPMLAAVAIAAAVHLLLLLGLGLELPQPAPPPVRTFEVMTVAVPADAKTAPPARAVPARAEGAGETSALPRELASGTAPDAPTPPKEPAPAETSAAPEPEAVAEPAAVQRDPETTGDAASAGVLSKPLLNTRPVDLSQILSGIGADIALPDLPAPTATPANAPNASAPDVFASRSAEIAALTARTNARHASQAGRARRKAISTNTREYRYAAYMEAWRRKVEAIGNLNYPQEAKQHGIFGSLILHAAISADGSLEQVRVVRSSGHPVLDQAAIDIVKLAAPYAPFPDDIKAETDVLDITRVWQFQRNNRLGWD
jgi:protein TonB